MKGKSHFLIHPLAPWNTKLSPNNHVVIPSEQVPEPPNIDHFEQTIAKQKSLTLAALSRIWRRTAHLTGDVGESDPDVPVPEDNVLLCKDLQEHRSSTDFRPTVAVLKPIFRVQLEVTQQATGVVLDTAACTS
jgi:hypothetical protein